MNYGQLSHLNAMMNQADNNKIVTIGNFGNGVGDWRTGQNIIVVTHESKQKDNANGEQTALAVDSYC